MGMRRLRIKGETVTSSIATQRDDQLGGSASVLVRQKRDHVELDRLLGAIDAAAGSEREELLNRLCRLVFPHAFAEESVLWPAIRSLVADGEQLTLRIEREHQEINELFSQLERTTVDSPRHHELWPQISALLRQDVRDEEDELLPKLRAAVPTKKLVSMGRTWGLVRRIAPTRPHPMVARRPPGNVAAALPLTIIDRARDRLDQATRRTSGRVAAVGHKLSGALARAAGAIEYIPPLTRGEHSSTNFPRADSR
jgi:hemerythrin superfamily protein